jgi:hypothetical protein
MVLTTKSLLLSVYEDYLVVSVARFWSIRQVFQNYRHCILLSGLLYR